MLDRILRVLAHKLQDVLLIGLQFVFLLLRQQRIILGRWSSAPASSAGGVTPGVVAGIGGLLSLFGAVCAPAVPTTKPPPIPIPISASSLVLHSKSITLVYAPPLRTILAPYRRLPEYGPRPLRYLCALCVRAFAFAFLLRTLCILRVLCVKAFAFAFVFLIPNP